MKTILIFFFVLLSSIAYSQTTYYIQADSVRFRKVGANSEFILENATRNVKGVLVNKGNGRTEFVHGRINGDTLFLGKDTIPGLSGNNTDSLFGVQDNSALQDRRINFHDDWGFYLDSLADLQIKRGGTMRIEMGNIATQLYSGDGNNTARVDNDGFYAIANSLNELRIKDDSIALITTNASLDFRTRKLPFKSSALSTDSLDLIDNVGKHWKIAISAIGGGSQSLQDVTDIGSTTTNSIIVDNANFDAINGTSFRVKDDNGNVAAILWYHTDDYGELRFKAGTGTINIYPQLTTNTNTTLFLPSTGNANDTIATLADVLAAGGGGSGANTALSNLASVAINTDFNVNNQVLYGNSNAYNAQTGTTYTLQSSDNGKIVTLSNGSAITLTVPTSLPAGFNCTLVQLGAGQVTITPSSTTVHNRQSFTKLKGQYAMCTIVQYGSNLYLTQGDME